jgi:uncharacterized protein with ParB-like and HNH nuclease domain
VFGGSVEARESTFLGLLDGSKHYSIPHYQRLYSWDFKQVDRLFRDVESLANTPEVRHFMGSIVYVSHAAKADGINNFVVIDGQQRLTTLSMLMLAIMKSMKLNSDDIKKRFNRTIRNGDEERGSDEYLKLRLTRTDDGVYRSLVNAVENDQQLDLGSSKLIRNFLRLTDLVQKSDADPAKLWSALARIDMVYISLDKGKDDPQAIFESLNSTGKNLSSTDLIRNFVLMDRSQDEQVSLYENYWSKIEDLFRDRKDTEFDEFTRAHLAASLERYPKKTDVYEEFTRSVRASYAQDGTPQDVLGNFRDSAKAYAFIHWQQTSDDPPSLQRALADYRALGLRLLHPLLLSFAQKNSLTQKYQPEVFERAIRVLESYLIRRVFCGLRSNALDNAMATVFNLKGKSSRIGVESLEDALLSLTGKARFPLDEEVRYRGQTMDLYSSNNAEHILKKLERFGDPAGLGLSAKVSIEHIMPQKLSRPWIASLGEDASRIRERLVHSLGNLTLTPYNSELGQRSFEDKKFLPKGGFSTSKFWLSTTILPYETWNEDSIMTRGDFLMDCALKVWPLPEIYGSDYRKIESATNKQDIDLPELLAAELLEPDSEIVWSRPQSGEVHRARVTESGTIVTSEGEEYDTPTAATRAFTTSNYNGWKEWRLADVDGPTLDELREKAASGQEDEVL